MRAKVQHRWRVALFLVLSLGAGLPGHHVVAAPLPQSPPPPSSPPPATPCAVAAVAALSKMGSPYSQGGNMPNDPRGPDGNYLPRTGPNSFDCSGLTWWAYQQANITIGSTTFQQYDDGVQLPCTMQDFKRTDCWAVGDLVFLRFSATHQHVSIVVDPQRGLAADCYNHQRGCFLHDITQDSSYHSAFWQGRRIVEGCGGVTIVVPPPPPGTGDEEGWWPVFPDAEEIWHSALYGVLRLVTGIVWALDRGLLNVIGILERFRQQLTTSGFRTAVQTVADNLGTYVPALFTLGLVLGLLLVMLQPALRIQLVNIRKVLVYAALIPILFPIAGATFQWLEETRADMGGNLFSTVATVVGFDLTDAGTPSPTAAMHTLTAYDPELYDDDLTFHGVDVAAAYLFATKQDVTEARELPAAFEAKYFEVASLDGRSEDERWALITQAGQGLGRVSYGIFLLLMALCESTINLVFTVSLGLLLIGLIISSIFGWFSPVEGITARLGQQLVELFMGSWGISLAQGLVIAALLGVAQTGNADAVFGMGIVAMTLEAIFLVTATKTLFNSFAGTTGAATGGAISPGEITAGTALATSAVLGSGAASIGIVRGVERGGDAGASGIGATGRVISSMRDAQQFAGDQGNAFSLGFGIGQTPLLARAGTLATMMGAGGGSFEQGLATAANGPRDRVPRRAALRDSVRDRHMKEWSYEDAQERVENRPRDRQMKQWAHEEAQQRFRNRPRAKQMQQWAYEDAQERVANRPQDRKMKQWAFEEAQERFDGRVAGKAGWATTPPIPPAPQPKSRIGRRHRRSGQAVGGAGGSSAGAVQAGAQQRRQQQQAAHRVQRQQQRAPWWQQYHARQQAQPSAPGGRRRRAHAQVPARPRSTTPSTAAATPVDVQVRVRAPGAHTLAARPTPLRIRPSVAMVGGRGRVAQRAATPRVQQPTITLGEHAVRATGTQVQPTTPSISMAPRIVTRSTRRPAAPHRAPRMRSSVPPTVIRSRVPRSTPRREDGE